MKKLILVLLAGVSGSLAIASTDYPANHCEIFVDQAAAWGGTYGYMGVTLKIKTLNSRLDGAIKQVGYHSIVRSTPEIAAFCAAHSPANGNANDCDTVGMWIDRPALSFFGPDYFRIDFEIRHDYTFTHIFEGTFFVETDKGTRYWLSPAGGGSFFIDLNMRGDLIARGSGGYYRQGKDINTADHFDYLNPGHCR